jgi:hypothetical protein
MNGRRRIALCVLASVAPALSSGQQNDLDHGQSVSRLDAQIARLESLFVSGEPPSFRAIRTSGELPAVPLALLRHESFDGKLAERGEPWSSGDIISDHEPMVQHVASWVSPSATLIVYRSGGWAGPRTNLLLYAERAPIYCIYGAYQRETPRTPTIESMQRLLTSGRDDGDPKPPCNAPGDVSSMRRIEVALDGR